MIDGVDKGLLIVISGPSGAGKSTVISRVLKSNPDIVFSVSATTRLPRDGEREGIDYYFTAFSQFMEMIARGELLEYAEYVGNYYGTPKARVFEDIENGKSVVLDIEVQGAMQVKEKYPQAVLIFLIPSSFSEIERRLRGRASDDEEKILLRIETAKKEYSLAQSYDYIVLNDGEDLAEHEILSIICAEKCKTVNRKKYLTEGVLA